MPALFWGVIVFLIISLPSSALPSTEKLRIPHFDKIVHFVMYAVFGALILLGHGRFKHKTSASKNQVIMSISVGILYGIITEFLQFCCFPDRHGNIYDVLANGFGTVFGVFLVVLFYKMSK